MTRSRRVTTGLLALAATALLLVSACGDDDDDAAGGGSATGEPIKILQWTTVDHASFSAPDTRAGARARVEAINKSGGIDGRMLELEFCNVNFDPNQEAACARRAIDGGFAAVVGSLALFPNTLPLLERGGVPFIGGQGVTPVELTSEISFPFASGIPGWYQGAAAMVLERGAQRVSVVSSPIGSIEFAAKLMNDSLTSVGKPAVRTVVMPLGAPDQSAAAAEAADGTDAVLVGGAPADTVKVVQSLRQSGYPGLIASVTTQFPADTIATLGDAANGILLTSQMTPASETDNPAIAKFIEDMDAAEPSAAKSERAVTAWAAVDLFAKLVERMDGEINAATVLAAMNNLSEPIETGVTAPYSTTGEPSVADFPRIVNPTIYFTEIREGQVALTGDEAVNPFELLTEMANR